MMIMCSLSGCAQYLVYQFSSAERQRALNYQDDYWMCTFPCFVLEARCPQAFVRMQLAHFLREDLTYFIPALFVSMYILTLSDVVHSSKFDWP